MYGVNRERAARRFLGDLVWNPSATKIFRRVNIHLYRQYMRRYAQINVQQQSVDLEIQLPDTSFNLTVGDAPSTAVGNHTWNEHVIAAIGQANRHQLDESRLSWFGFRPNNHFTGELPCNE